MFLVFDTAAFYMKCTSDDYQKTVRSIIESNQIRDLITVIERYKNREDIRELLSLIDQRYSR